MSIITDFVNEVSLLEKPFPQSKAIEKFLRTADVERLELPEDIHAKLISLVGTLRDADLKTDTAECHVKYLDAKSSATKISWARKKSSIEWNSEIYLPRIPENKIGLPRALLSSAFFPVTTEVGGTDVAEIPAKDASIRTEGPKLNGFDQLVLGILLREASKHPLADMEASSVNWLSISRSDLCKALSIKPGAMAYKAIAASLARLSHKKVNITLYSVTVKLDGLVQVLDFVDKNINFRVSRDFAELFGPGTWVLLPEEFVRESNEYARWLAGFSAANWLGVDLPMEKVYALCGAQCGLDAFRRKVKAALTKLSQEDIHPDIRVAQWSINKHTNFLYIS